jgi:hypothetical protein
MKGQIEIKSAQSVTTARFPFPGPSPSLGDPRQPATAAVTMAKDRCQSILDALSPYQRDTVLMLLVNRYGNIVR